MSELERLKEIVESFRRTNHYECEDGFYSCPAHPEYFGNDSSKECDCGLARDNAKVDEALQIISGLTKRATDVLRAQAISGQVIAATRNKRQPLEGS